MLAPHALTVQGRIFLDRCGQLFAEVLSLLRDGPEWRPPEDWCVRRPVAFMCVCVWGGGAVAYMCVWWWCVCGGGNCIHV